MDLTDCQICQPGTCAYAIGSMFALTWVVLCLISAHSMCIRVWGYAGVWICLNLAEGAQGLECLISQSLSYVFPPPPKISVYRYIVRSTVKLNGLYMKCIRCNLGSIEFSAWLRVWELVNAKLFVGKSTSMQYPVFTPLRSSCQPLKTGLPRYLTQLLPKEKVSMFEADSVCIYTS